VELGLQQPGRELEILAAGGQGAGADGLNGRPVGPLELRLPDALGQAGIVLPARLLDLVVDLGVAQILAGGPIW